MIAQLRICVTHLYQIKPCLPVAMAFIFVIAFCMLCYAEESTQIQGEQIIESSDDPAEAVGRIFLRGMESGDLELLRSCTLANTEHLERLVVSQENKPALTEEQLDEKVSQVGFELMPPQGLDPAGGWNHRRVYCLNFSGMVFPLHLLLEEGQWKVDARWWIDSRSDPTDDKQAIRKFMWGLICKDAAIVSEVAVENVDLDILTSGESPPAGEMWHYRHLCESMPIVEAALGEGYWSNEDEWLKVNPDDLGDNRRIMIGVFGFSEIPFLLIRDEDGWRVDATAFIQVMQAEQDE